MSNDTRDRVFTYFVGCVKSYDLVGHAPDVRGRMRVATSSCKNKRTIEILRAVPRVFTGKNNLKVYEISDGSFLQWVGKSS